MYMQSHHIDTFHGNILWNKLEGEEIRDCRLITNKIVNQNNQR